MHKVGMWLFRQFLVHRAWEYKNARIKPMKHTVAECWHHLSTHSCTNECRTPARKKNHNSIQPNLLAWLDWFFTFSFHSYHSVNNIELSWFSFQNDSVFLPKVMMRKSFLIEDWDRNPILSRSCWLKIKRKPRYLFSETQNRIVRKKLFLSLNFRMIYNKPYILLMRRFLYRFQASIFAYLTMFWLEIQAKRIINCAHLTGQRRIETCHIVIFTAGSKKTCWNNNNNDDIRLLHYLHIYFAWNALFYINFRRLPKSKRREKRHLILCYCSVYFFVPQLSFIK